jgi:hypothetical protein
VSKVDHNFRVESQAAQDSTSQECHLPNFVISKENDRIISQDILNDIENNSQLIDGSVDIPAVGAIAKASSNLEGT